MAHLPLIRVLLFFDLLLKSQTLTQWPFIRWRVHSITEQPTRQSFFETGHNNMAGDMYWNLTLAPNNHKSIRRSFYLDTFVLERFRGSSNTDFVDNIVWDPISFQVALHRHFVQKGVRVDWDAMTYSAIRSLHIAQIRAILMGGLFLTIALCTSAAGSAALTFAAGPLSRCFTNPRLVTLIPSIVATLRGVGWGTLRPKGAGGGGYNGVRVGEARHPGPISRVVTPPTFQQVSRNSNSNRGQGAETGKAHTIQL